MSLRRSWIALVCGALAWPWALPVARAEDPTAQVPADSAASTDQAAEKKYSLAFKFEPHQILRYEVTTEQEITTTARDESEIQKNFTKARRHQRVTSHDDKTGEADLELTIDWVY
ncbi:MAG: hypothetical protein JSS02_35305, partial [Planctomycetes bacterium]|nr:hypothetical protein [Planctomycetota bacterium]